MVATSSTMVRLGTKAHSFCLPDTKSETYYEFNLSSQTKGCLIAFICNHCPYVLHLLPTLTKLCKRWQGNGLKVIFISSNDVQKYPADAPNLMMQLAKEHDFSFPYLFDEDQKVAISYQASCTPDFFLYDSDYCLFYRGQFDDSRPGNDQEVNGHHLKVAVERLLSNRSAPEIQNPSLGCNLKWKNGNEPDYFNPSK